MEKQEKASHSVADAAMMASFERICQDEIFGFVARGHVPHLPIPEAGHNLRLALEYIGSRMGFVPAWLPEYDEVADYLQDPGGRGLLLFGDCGRGKSLIVERAIPLLMNHFYGKIFSPISANSISERTLADLLCRSTLVIDDIGTEPRKVYGEQRSPISAIMDDAERRGKLLFMTTNLEVESGKGRDSLEERYGSRTYDRFVSNCHIIEFRGDSLRV